MPKGAKNSMLPYVQRLYNYGNFFLNEEFKEAHILLERVSQQLFRRKYGHVHH
jgi:hypothetical protein